MTTRKGILAGSAKDFDGPRNQSILAAADTGQARCRQVEEKMRLQAQKMESVGRLAGGVAHNFNNKLAIIVGYAEVAMAEIDPCHPAQTSLQKIMQAAQDCAGLTEQLLAFASKQMVSPRVLDLNDTVAGMEMMLQLLAGCDKEFVMDLATELCQVEIDPVQIDQILAILCTNARDAMSGAGRITIETKNVHLDDDDCASRTACRPGRYVRLAVTDNGCGMEPEVVSNIFEPFFTTKNVGQGNGMGLASLYGIVNQNKGFIEVFSAPGQGTTMAVYLPSTTQARAATVVREGPLANGHCETVLVVEDEPAILHLCKTMLEGLGYTVLTAGTPAEALRKTEAHPATIHLLLTDICLPDMNGGELAEHLAAVRPGIKKLFMSGYNANIIAEQGILASGVPFIEKPFTLHLLAEKVKEVLSSD